LTDTFGTNFASQNIVLTLDFVRNIKMNTISAINNNMFAPQPKAQEPEKVEVSFQDMLEEVGEAGKNDKVEIAYEKSSAERFKELMDMSIGERYFELYLKQEGMTREEFEALPPEEQEQIVNKFQEEMDQKISGKLTNTSLL